MKTNVFEGYRELSEAVAHEVLRQLAQKPGSVFCFPSGTTPLELFDVLVEWHKSGKTDFSESHFIGLDEWVGLGREDEGSCLFTLCQHLFEPMNIKPRQIHFFNAKAENLNQECAGIEQKIASLGGIDFCVLGIGMNGHLGFNEPGTPFDAPAHVTQLAPVTKTVGQKYFQKTIVLDKGITLGLKTIANSRKIILMANGQKKSAILKTALEGKVTEDIPASILQTLPQASVFADREAKGG